MISIFLHPMLSFSSLVSASCRSSILSSFFSLFPQRLDIDVFREKSSHLQYCSDLFLPAGSRSFSPQSFYHRNSTALWIPPVLFTLPNQYYCFSLMILSILLLRHNSYGFNPGSVSWHFKVRKRRISEACI